MAYDLGNKKHVFVDWDLIEPGYGVASGGERPEPWEMPHGVRLAVHKPRIDPEPLVQPDQAWETDIDGKHTTLFEDDGRFRLYYNPWDRMSAVRGGEERPTDRMLAYAESTDGVNWVKPRVGTVELEGSKDNNLVFPLNTSSGRPGHSAFVFKDPNGTPDQRYKLIYTGREDGQPTMFGAVSPDGLRWELLESPILRNYHADTHNVMRFDEEKGRYVGYFRGWKGSELGKYHGRRTIAYAESDRFESWPVPQTIVATDAHDSPDTDIYTNAYSPWPGANAHLMFPAFYHRALDVRDVPMFTSRDGIHWERLMREPVIPFGGPGTDYEGGVSAGAGLVSLRPGEWSIPISPYALSHNNFFFADAMKSPRHTGFVCLATWRQDGFTSLEAESQGECTTVPLTFDGSRLQLNAWTRFGGEIRIELADASGETRERRSSPAIEGHGFGDCDPITGDMLDGTVSWRGKSDLSAWTGKLVRLRLQMRRARLYALQFV